MRIDQEQARGPEVEARIERHEQRLARAKAAWAVARRTYYEGRLDEAAYEGDREHYEGEIRMLEGELARMRDAVDLRVRHQATVEEIESMASRWSEVREALTEEERREIIWALVEDVTITPEGEITVTGRLAGLAGCPTEVMVGDTGLEPVASSV